MNLSQRFWDASQSIISTTEKHLFLTSMVHGTLSQDKFIYYVLQDALYLTDFSDCLFRLSKKAPSPIHQKRLAELAKGAEEDEKELHRSFFQKWNIDDDKVEPMPNTVLYTSYMMKVVATRPYAEGLAVLLPCFWVYMHVGKQMLKLREKLGDSVDRIPQFDAWIDLYASQEFEKEVKDYIAMVDEIKVQEKDHDDDHDGDIQYEYAKEYQSEEDMIKKMEQHFIMCCKLEHMFWDQAEALMKWPHL